MGAVADTFDIIAATFRAENLCRAHFYIALLQIRHTTYFSKQIQNVRFANHPQI